MGFFVLRVCCEWFIAKGNVFVKFIFNLLISPSIQRATTQFSAKLFVRILCCESLAQVVVGFAVIGI